MSSEGTDQFSTGLEVAIIGMAGRFPGASNLSEFWDNLQNGVETISFFSHRELEEDGVPAWESMDPNYIQARGMLDKLDHFDAGFFGYTPEEARRMDPQMRLFHEIAWQTLEDGGYEPGTYPGLIGLYAGATNSAYWQKWAAMTDVLMELDSLPTVQLSDKDHLCSRVAYKLDLKGPAFALSTQCSTSLVATHLACQGLISGECDMALAGGVAATIPQKSGYIYLEGMLLSRSGHCRSFAGHADGTVFGNGAAAVLLKRLADAAADGDHIYAVIKASAINSDGSSRVSYPAPGVEGQAAVIKTALQVSQLEPETIGYVEAHGTATLLGDPIEIEALKLAFATDKKGYCLIGTVKSNLGHLDAAAGVTGLIKTALILTHGLIPPSLHFERANPNIDFENSAFRVVTALTPWSRGEYPRRAGVSAFGIGGTNAHVILEEAPVSLSGGELTENRSRPGDYFLIPLSAKTETALERRTRDLLARVKEKPEIPLADLAFTLQTGRCHFRCRRLAVGKDVREITAALSSPGTGSGSTFSRAGKKQRLPVVFMFSGLGSGYVDMGRGLYQRIPLFREEMDRCFRILEPLSGVNLKEILYPGGITDNTGSPPGAGHREILPERHVQTLMFIFQYALARLLIHWGISPRAMIGYSFGEYAAACISGVFSLEEGLRIVAARAALVEQTAEGAMLNVPLSKTGLLPLLPPGLSLAIDNDSSCLVAGPKADVDAFARQMKEKKYVCMRLETTKAVHSATMTPILETFEQQVRTITLHPPAIPYPANVTGKWITAAEATDPGYWSKHLRSTVYFADGIKALLEQEKECLFLEIGPGRDLSTLVLRYLDDDPGQHRRVIDLVRVPGREVPDVAFLLNRVGRLWLYGIEPDWSSFYPGGKPRRLSLPPYPFDADGQSYRLAGKNEFQVQYQALSQLFAFSKKELSQWFYRLSWKRLKKLEPLVAGENGPAGQAGICQWLILTGPGEDSNLLARQVAEGLREQEGQEVFIAAAASGFSRQGDHSFEFDPANPGDYLTLLNHLRSGSPPVIPRKILHLANVWDVEAKRDFSTLTAEVKRALEQGFYSLIYLAQALGRQELPDHCEILAISDHLQEVAGDERLCPGRATMLAPLRVIQREDPGISCRSIDIAVPPPGSAHREELIRQLLEEVAVAHGEPVVALRGRHRWVPVFEKTILHPPADRPQRLRTNGRYLITGGLGGMGLTLARYLAETAAARLILVSRSPLPPREEWQQWLEQPVDQDVNVNSTREKIEKIRDLEALGAEVKVCCADVTDARQLRSVVTEAVRQGGPVHGVIHAAGIADGGIIQLRTRETLDNVLAAKVWGTLALDEVMKDMPLDFFVLCSSTSSVLFPGGQVAYCAANAFLDAYAYFKNASGTDTTYTVSVNWDAWKETGMAVNAVNEADRGKTLFQARDLERTGISPGEGIEVFNLVLDQSLPQVTVSTRDLSALMLQLEFQDKRLRARDAESGKAGNQAPSATGTSRDTAAAESYQRPVLSNPYKAPANEIEQLLAEVLQKSTGFGQVGVEDDFFELGIDSIKMIQVRSRLSKQGYTVDMGDFFQYPSIAQLAPHIKRSKEPDTRTAGTRAVPGTGISHPLPQPVLDRLAAQFPYPITDFYPLTPMQEGMLFYSEYERENTATYFEQMSYRLQGQLEIPLVEKSVNLLIQRHDILRTAFVYESLERPLQVVLSQRPALFFYRDLRPLPGNRERESALRQYREKDRRKRFDLATDVLMRVTVFQTGESDYFILWSYHHILMDGWCSGIIQTEFFEIYYSLLKNRPPQLPPVQSYQTYIQWLQDRDRQQSLAYWQEYLEGYRGISGIPKRKGHETGGRGYRDASAYTVLEKESLERLKRLAVRYHVTLNTVFQAVWALVLGKYCGKEDVVFGVVVSGRPAEIRGVEAMIGCFINTIPLRITFEQHTRFTTLLETIQQRAIRSEPHHYCSLADIQTQCDSKEDLLDHIMEFQNFPAAQKIEGAIDAEKEDYREVPIVLTDAEILEQSNYDLNVMILPGTEQLTLGVAYNANVYEAELIGQLGVHSMRVIRQILDNENVTLGEITLISEAEKESLLENIKRRDQTLTPSPLRPDQPVKRERPKPIETDFDF